RPTPTGSSCWMPAASWPRAKLRMWPAARCFPRCTAPGSTQGSIRSTGGSAWPRPETSLGAKRLGEDLSDGSLLFGLEFVLGAAVGPVGGQRHGPAIHSTFAVEVGTQRLHGLSLAVGKDLEGAFVPVGVAHGFL